MDEMQMNESQMKDSYPREYAELGVLALDNLARFYVIITSAGANTDIEPRIYSIIGETYDNLKRRLPEKYDGLHQLADKVYAELMARNHG